ncbi:MAG: ATP-binding cassette domain-containing protein, partial [Anaerolineae bacterium]|nr:ATP-binding cassette domain-containing protein [Anaerolineae bacterium]
MSILTATNLGKYYDADDIFEGISIEIPHKARVALVGPNGAGKTTLLNILIGADTPTAGSVSIAKGLRIGFLPQRPELVGGHSLWEELLRAFDDLRAMEAQLGDIEHRLTTTPADDGLLHRYGELQHRFEEAGGYTYETRIRMILQGLSFTPDDFNRPLTQLSGGQKTRALLGRLLLDEPDLLVLDEPTNHLDIAAVEWLEHFLRDFPGAVLAVSHDRYFMDMFATTVWEMDFGEIEVYRGNYSHYAQQRVDRHERRLKEYEAQQEFLAKEEDYIRRNIAGQNTRQAKGKLRRLETMQKRGKILSRPKTRRSMYLKMGRTMRSGDKVLMTYNLSVGYPDAKAPLFRSPDITLYRGEVAALIGPNGVGKSTFLKTILGQLAPLAGESRIGAAVDIGYFAQAHERLNPQNSIMDEITTVKPMPVSEARNYLGKFLFTGDDVFRPVATLSGGERGRVALAKLALSGANFLLLDEPTNHLDIESQEILQDVLADYDGTILLVSHDRYLIDALATQIWSAEPGKLTVFNGNYREFAAARDAETASVSTPV